jgi:hypothetical protein
VTNYISARWLIRFRAGFAVLAVLSFLAGFYITAVAGSFPAVQDYDHPYGHLYKTYGIRYLTRSQYMIDQWSDVLWVIFVVAYIIVSALLRRCYQAKS